MGAVAVGACAACCVGPVLAILGGIGVAAAVAAVWVPAFAVVVVLAGLGVLVLRRRRGGPVRPAGTVVSLGLPVRRDDVPDAETVTESASPPPAARQ